MSSASRAGAGPLGRLRSFSILIGYALLLGVVGAAAGLVFMGVTGLGTTGTTFLVRAPFGANVVGRSRRSGACVVLGLLRSLTKRSAKIPG